MRNQRRDQEQPLRLETGVLTEDKSRAVLREQVSKTFEPLRTMVEGGPVARLKFLLNLCQISESEFEERWKEELSYWVAAFVQATVESGDYMQRPLPKDQLLQAVQEVRRNMTLLALGRPWKISLSIDLTITQNWTWVKHQGAPKDVLRSPLLREWGQRFSAIEGSDDFGTAFYIAVIRTMQEPEVRWLKCKRHDCNNLFVQTSARTEYCSSRCSQTERTRSYRKAKKAKPEG